MVSERLFLHSLENACNDLWRKRRGYGFNEVYSVWVIGGAAVFSICLAFIGKVSAVIRAMPAPVMDGVSIFYSYDFSFRFAHVGRIRVDYMITKLITSAVILILAIGKARLTIGPMEIEGMALRQL